MNDEEIRQKQIEWQQRKKYMGMVTMTDHDLLICIDVKLKELKQQFSNHIRHHWMITIPLIGITAGAIISLIIALLSH